MSPTGMRKTAPTGERPAWMRQDIERRRRELRQRRSVEGTIFVMPLRGSWDNIIGTDEDRTCDRCRTYVPPDLDFWIDGIPLRSTKTGQIALLSYGLCSSCDAEDD